MVLAVALGALLIVAVPSSVAHPLRGPAGPPSPSAIRPDAVGPPAGTLNVSRIGWSDLTPGLSLFPSDRAGTGFTYDSSDGYYLLVNGYTAGGYSTQWPNDTWIFANGSWTDVTSKLNTNPPCSYLSPMADDPVDGYVVLLETPDAPQPCGSVTWPGATWTYHNYTWTHLATNTSPPIPGGELAWDPALGGDVYTDALYATSADPVDNQTWLFSHGNWTNLTATLGPEPPARAFAGMAYDPALDGMILFGGQATATFSGGPNLNDTWLLNGSGWHLLPSPHAPSPRQFPALATLGGTTFLFGGMGIGPSGPYDQADSWVLNGTTWVNVTASLSPSPPTTGSGSVPQLVTNSTDGNESGLLFGGYSVNKTWALHAAGNLVTGSGGSGGSGGAGVSLPVRWTNLTNLTTFPSPRLGAAMTYDASDGYYLLSDGYSFVTGVPLDPNDTWAFSNGSWTNLTPSIAQLPPVDEHGAMTYDPVDGYVVMVEGDILTPSASYQGTTWTYHANVWSELTNASSPGLYDTALAWAPSLGYAIAFGGLGCGPTYCNETWGFVHGSWTNLTATVGAAPPPRTAASLVYDAALGGLVLFGGATSTTFSRSNYLNDTWLLNGTGWHNLTSETAPSKRDNAGFVEFAGVPYLFGGGWISPLSGVADLNDSWMLNGTTWENITTQIGRSPPTTGLGNFGETMAANVTGANGGSSAILFGGRTYNATYELVLNGSGNSSWGGTGNGGSGNGSGNNSGNRSGNNSGNQSGNNSGSGSGGHGAPRLGLSVGAIIGEAPLDAALQVNASAGVGPYALTICTGTAGCRSALRDWSGGTTFVWVGTYTASTSVPMNLTLTDAAGDTSYASLTLAVVVLTPLSVTAGVAPVAGAPSADVTFVLAVSGGLTPYTILWTFGDGSVGSSLAQGELRHQYPGPGTFAPQVEVTDAQGQQVTVDLPTVHVAASPASSTTVWGGLTATPLLLVGVALAALGLTSVVVGLWGHRRLVDRQGRRLLRALTQIGERPPPRAP